MKKGESERKRKSGRLPESEGGHNASANSAKTRDLNSRKIHTGDLGAGEDDIGSPSDKSATPRSRTGTIGPEDVASSEDTKVGGPRYNKGTKKNQDGNRSARFADDVEGDHRATPDSSSAEGSPRTHMDAPDSPLSDEYGNKMTSTELAFRRAVAAEVVPLQPTFVPILGRKVTPSVSLSNVLQTGTSPDRRQTVPSSSSRYSRSEEWSPEKREPSVSVQSVTAEYNAGYLFNPDEPSSSKSVTIGDSRAERSAGASASASARSRSNSNSPNKSKSLDGSTKLVGILKKPKKDVAEQGNKELHVMSETLLPGEARTHAEEQESEAVALARKLYESLPAVRVAVGRKNRRPSTSPSRKMKLDKKRKRTTRKRDFGAELTFFLREAEREYEASGRLMPVGEVELRMQALQRRKAGVEEAKGWVESAYRKKIGAESLSPKKSAMKKKRKNEDLLDEDGEEAYPAEEQNAKRNVKRARVLSVEESEKLKALCAEEAEIALGARAITSGIDEVEEEKKQFDDVELPFDDSTLVEFGSPSNRRRYMMNNINREGVHMRSAGRQAVADASVADVGQEIVASPGDNDKDSALESQTSESDYSDQQAGNALSEEEACMLSRVDASGNRVSVEANTRLRQIDTELAAIEAMEELSRQETSLKMKFNKNGEEVHDVEAEIAENERSESKLIEGAHEKQDQARMGEREMEIRTLEDREAVRNQRLKETDDLHHLRKSSFNP